MRGERCLAPHRNTDPLTSWVLPCASRRSGGGAARNMEACGNRRPRTWGGASGESRGGGAAKCEARDVWPRTETQILSLVGYSRARRDGRAVVRRGTWKRVGTDDPEHGEARAGSRGDGAQRSARREIFSGTLCCTQTHAHYLELSQHETRTLDRSCSRPFYFFRRENDKQLSILKRETRDTRGQKLF